ncbi:MAG: hypothetical protein ACE37F_32230 [Nannocystaceae bacterium]|nr:hypothetical protein [bacterium]
MSRSPLNSRVFFAASVWLASACAGSTADAPPPPSVEPSPVEPEPASEEPPPAAEAPVQPDEPAAAVEDPSRACELGDAQSCWKATLAAYAEEDFAKARTMAEAICTESVTTGCGVLGVLYAKGQGVAQDVERSRGYLVRACEAKDAEACRNLEALEAAIAEAQKSEVLPVAGANVSIGSITVDGLSAEDLRCRREVGGGLFGGAMGAISGIAKRKKRLMACAASPTPVRARWTTKGGRIETVEVNAPSKKVESCVAKAIKGSSAAFGGTCAATFTVGE